MVTIYVVLEFFDLFEPNIFNVSLLTEGDCNPSKKELQIKAASEETKKIQKESSVMDSPQSQSQSSDEAKESDNSDHDKKNNNSDGNNKTSLKYTCDTCNVNVNSTTQLSQVKTTLICHFLKA